MGYIFLALAIAAEVVATAFLKLASGENARWWDYAVVIVGYVASFAALSRALALNVPLGIAYAIWAAVGVVVIVLISWLFFNESLSWVQIIGLVLVIGGVGLLELGGQR
ncbi:MAG: multidrug efflux SMR transporter [Lacisediminihabitans sp.]